MMSENNKSELPRLPQAGQKYYFLKVSSFSYRNLTYAVVY